MKNDKDVVSTSPAEIEALIKRIEASSISEGDKNLVVRMLRLVLVVQHSLRSKQATLLKLKELILGRRSGQAKRSGDEAAPSQENKGEEAAQGRREDDRSSEQAAFHESRAESEAIQEKAHPGHGRIPADEYKSAAIVECQHDRLRPGDSCPHQGCEGRLYDTGDPLIFIRLEGKPVITATRFEQQVLRCSACQYRFAARLPDEVLPEKYDATADATIALMKYGAGMPWYRLAKLQRLMDLPLPVSNQFERCEAVAEAVAPVYRQLELEAARGEVFYSDDTSVKILACLKENRARTEDERQGLHTTGMVSQIRDKQIAMYKSGRRHSGENLEEIVRLRPPGLPPPIVMGDAEAKNWSSDFKKIVAKCLQHGRRKFTELEANFPIECSHVLDQLGEVYKNEAKTRLMSSSERLLYHQSNSKPIMDRLREWIGEQMDTRQVEPNSGLGQAMRYVLRHWDGLTTFLKKEGAPIDNNLVERILRLAVLSRKNSLFYKTQHGADIGDILMSVIQTCALNRVNPFDYLVKLIRKAGEVSRDPASWLPWNYQHCKESPSSVD
jgi:transposase